jgi:hypothetical protein
MTFILFVMFFTTPPILGPDRPWALQSTQSSEFDSWNACDDAIRKNLIPAVQSTDTVSVFGWCLPKAFKGKERQEFLESKNFAPDQIQTAMENYGSCYYYVPLPVPLTPARSKKRSVNSVVSGVPGQCGKSTP